MTEEQVVGVLATYQTELNRFYDRVTVVVVLTFAVGFFLGAVIALAFFR